MGMLMNKSQYLKLLYMIRNCILCVMLIVGMLIFVGEYTMKADDWAVFPGNPHVYTGTNIGCGVVTDADGSGAVQTAAEIHHFRFFRQADLHRVFAAR